MASDSYTVRVPCKELANVYGQNSGSGVSLDMGLTSTIVMFNIYDIHVRQTFILSVKYRSRVDDMHREPLWILTVLETITCNARSNVTDPQRAMIIIGA